MKIDNYQKVKKMFKKITSLKKVYPVLSIVFLFLSLIAGTVLVKQKQDLRDKAASGCSGCSCKHCPSGCHEDNIPNGGCPGGTAYCCSPKTEPGPGPGPVSGEGQACGKFNGGSCGPSLHCCKDGRNIGGSEDGGTCLKTCSSQTNPNCSTCNVRCDRFGCRVSGTNINCSTDCNMWPMCFYCHGKTGSGCGDGYYQDPRVKYDKQYWCSTIQCDVGGISGAIVVSIGDGGAWCTSDGQCGGGATKPSDLDWDCENITPTITPTRITTISSTPTDTP
ncbi:hypothetical protein DRH14_04785, partial [Candidatus Shapirobacteria bacterium]